MAAKKIQKKPTKRLKLGLIFFESSPADYACEAQVFGNRFELIRLPVEEELDYAELEKQTRGCDVILNIATFGTVAMESQQIAKSLEELGKTVINSSHSFYYQEDKWMFYLKCLEHKLPTPRTYLIPKEGHYRMNALKDILERTPLVIKSTISDNGQCVERAVTYEEFLHKLKKLREKNPLSPIIAQEYVPNKKHSSYRATLIDHKVVQFIKKESAHWKQTGHDNEWMGTAACPPEVKRLCERASHAFDIPLCGFDLLEHDGRWTIIEVNSSPSFRFVYRDQKRITELLADYLEKLARKLARKRGRR